MFQRIDARSTSGMSLLELVLAIGIGVVVVFFGSQWLRNLSGVSSAQLARAMSTQDEKEFAAIFSKDLDFFDQSTQLRPTNCSGTTCSIRRANGTVAVYRTICTTAPGPVHNIAFNQTLSGACIGAHGCASGLRPIVTVTRPGEASKTFPHPGSARGSAIAASACFSISPAAGPATEVTVTLDFVVLDTIRGARKESRQMILPVGNPSGLQIAR